MLSLVAPKRNEMIEHPKVFRASRMGCLNTAANRVFTAWSCEMDYTYDPPQHDYEHARWPCVPEECEFSVIGAVNQRFQPVPQETFTITSGEINGVFHQDIYGYDSMSGVFVWPNRDPLGEPGFEVIRALGFHPDSIENNDEYNVNLFAFIGNMVLMIVDVDGLTWYWPPSWSFWPPWHLPNHPQLPISPTGTTCPGPGYGKTTIIIWNSFWTTNPTTIR